MSESPRPLVHRLATASFALGLAALACTVILLSGAWHAPRVTPWERWNLWWQARLNFWLWGILAATALSFACSQIALGRLPRIGGRREYWLARGGKATAATGAVLMLFGAMFEPLWVRPSEGGRKTQCLSNIKNVALAIEMYAEDYDHFPASAHWCDTLAEYMRNPDVHRCPQAEGRSGQAYNVALGGLPSASVADPDRVVAVFDGEGGWNSSGGRALLPSFPRHLHGDNFGFPDGHAKWQARKQPAGEVRWDTDWPRELKDATVQWQPKLEERAR